MVERLPGIGRLRAALHQDDFWHGERRVSDAFRPDTLAGYPNDLSAKTRFVDGPRNEVGVPLCDYGPSVGHRLHPVTACQVALGWHERWIVEGGAHHRRRFLDIAEWLIRHQVPWAGGGAWPVEVTYRLYGRLEAPWVSALIQGQALSVLARAALHPELAAPARRAMEAARVLFERDVAQGGVRTEDEHGVAFEEYPSERPSMVLNGLISALWGLHDLALLEGDGPARRAFDAGAEALIARLPRYDVGFWSRYDLHPSPVPNVASPYYHREHLAQLAAMARLVPHPAWSATRARWLAYQRDPLNRCAALAAKALFRVVHGPRTRAGAFEPAAGKK